MNNHEIFKNVTVLTVTHNSENVIKKFLKSLDRNLKLVVVDNESKDQTRAILKKQINKSIRLIFNDKGLGFGKAANIGLRTIKTDYVMLINPDARIDLYPYQNCIKRQEFIKMQQFLPRYIEIIMVKFMLPLDHFF